MPVILFGLQCFNDLYISQDPEDEDLLTRAFDMFDDDLAPNLYNLERGILIVDLINTLRDGNTYIRYWTGSSLIKVIAYRRLDP